jgi:hypothetical protein
MKKGICEKSDNNSNRILNIDGVDYKLRKIIDSTAENIHHIIWKCNKQDYKVEDPINKMTINAVKHQCINDLFRTLQSPHEQFRFMWEIRKPVLSAWVNRAIYDILTLPRDMFYKEQLIKWKDRTKSLWKDGWGRG